jgi:hypothetical protein
MKTSQFIKQNKKGCYIVDSVGLLKELKAFEKKKRDKALSEKDVKQVKRVVKFMPLFKGIAPPTLLELIDRAERAGKRVPEANPVIRSPVDFTIKEPVVSTDKAKETKKIDLSGELKDAMDKARERKLNKKVGDKIDKIQNMDLSMLTSEGEEKTKEVSKSSKPSEDKDLKNLQKRMDKQEEKEKDDKIKLEASKRDVSAEARKEMGFGKDDELVGLSEDQLNTMMEKIGDPDYVKAIASDELHLLPSGKSCTTIINNLPRSSGGMHWRALRIDFLTNSVEFFDPFGSISPANGGLLSDKELVGIKKLTKSNPKMMKLKQNTVQNQKITTDSCGWLSIKFLQDRANGVSYKDATNYIEPTQDFSDKSESEIIDLKKKFKSFI